MTTGTYTLVKSMLKILAAQGILSESIQIDLETIRLSALIEGMSIHALLRPDVYTPEKVQDVIRYHLETLCK